MIKYTEQRPSCTQIKNKIPFTYKGQNHYVGSLCDRMVGPLGAWSRVFTAPLLQSLINTYLGTYEPAFTLPPIYYYTSFRTHLWEG